MDQKLVEALIAKINKASDDMNTLAGNMDAATKNLAVFRDHHRVLVFIVQALLHYAMARDPNLREPLTELINHQLRAASGGEPSWNEQNFLRSILGEDELPRLH